MKLPPAAGDHDSIRPPEEVKKIIDRVSELVINAEIKRNLDKRREGKDEDDT